MGSGDLAADLTLGNLAPASAVRAVDGQSHQETAGRAPRRRRVEMENKAEDGSENCDEPIPTSDDHAPAHQLDHLA